MTRSRALAVAVAAVTVASALAGCSGGGGPTTGTLMGVTHVYGGADGQGVGAPGGGVEVDAVSPADVTTKAVSDQGGRYSITLKPGIYVLSACGQQLPVTVHAGQVTKHDVNCAT